MKRLIAIFFFLALLPFTAHAAATSPDVNIIFASETQLTVYVNNEWSDTLSGTYGFGDTATLNAPTVDGKVFSHWEADGSIVSYSSSLKLTMNAHTTLYAVYADTAPTTKTTAGFTSITRTSDGSKISFQAIADGTITTAGIVYSTVTSGDELKIGGAEVTNVAAEKFTASTTELPQSILDDNNNWMLQISSDNGDTLYYARAYVTSGGSTTYGDVKDVKLSELESGISLVANLDDPESENSLDDLLTDLKNTTYSISYNLQGGTVSTANPANYSVTTGAFTLNNPTRTGYDFAGWTGTGITGTSTNVTVQRGVTGSRAYTANWSTIEYAIRYTVNNGTASENPTNYTIETETFTLNNPSREGYEFSGWTGTELSEPTQSVTIAQGSIGDRAYTGNFTPIVYSLTYNLNGGTNDPDNPSSYTIETETITLNAPTKAGYEFSGWTCNGEPLAAIVKGSMGNKNLTATWGETTPRISPSSYNLQARQGQPASLTISATGVNLQWNIDGSLPSGLTFSSSGNSATISGTPEAGTAGEYSVLVTAANDGGEATANVTITVASQSESGGGDDDDDETPETRKNENGESETSTSKTFKNASGQVILSSNVSITAEAETFKAAVGNLFATTIAVDVTLNLADENYKNYEYSMTVTGLPEWLSAEGELESSGNLEVGEAKQHYEFTLTGTPTALSDAQTVNLAASVKINGADPELEASGNKEIQISVSSPETTLQSMSVEIAGDDTLTTNAGTSSSITLTANVQGTFYDGQTRILPAGSYALTWTADDTLANYGLSFTDGTLSVNENAPAGTNEIQITATAESGDVSGTGIKTVTVTVISAEQTPTVPVLTCTTETTTIKRGATIAALTVRADVTPQEWLSSGELPDGLSYRTDGNKFVISGTVSQNAEAKDYVYTVQAKNEAGTSEAITITITVSATETTTPGRVEVSAGEISEMNDTELQETFANRTDIALTGEVENIAESIERLETVTDIKTLDLSQVTGITDLKLNHSSLETLILDGNQSIKTVDLTGNTSLTELNLKDCLQLEMVDLKGCEGLESVNLEGCESLEYLDVSETKITELDVHGCINLGTLNCYSCDIENINLEGCEKLDTLDCSYNSLLVFNASDLNNLQNLECRHQRIYNKPLARLMNFLDLLLGRGVFSSSALKENNGAEILSNVKNLKAYNAAGQELSVELDSESGEVIFGGEPAKIAYDYATGFNGVMMDVEVYKSANQQESSSSINSGSSGGCNSGFEIGALALMLILFKKKFNN